jgi:DNA-binding MarR family transcriptional regulator
MAARAPDLLDLLLHSARAIEGRLEAALATAGLTGSRYQVLQELAAAGEPLPLGELAARASCVRSNMTQLVDRMEKDGLVRRVSDGRDRRTVRAELTATGRERQRAGARVLTAVRKELSGAIPQNQRAALQRVLAALG